MMFNHVLRAKRALAGTGIASDVVAAAGRERLFDSLEV